MIRRIILFLSFFLAGFFIYRYFNVQAADEFLFKIKTLSFNRGNSNYTTSVDGEIIDVPAVKESLAETRDELKEVTIEKTETTEEENETASELSLKLTEQTLALIKQNNREDNNTIQTSESPLPTIQTTTTKEINPDKINDQIIQDIQNGTITQSNSKVDTAIKEKKTITTIEKTEQQKEITKTEDSSPSQENTQELEKLQSEIDKLKQELEKIKEENQEIQQAQVIQSNTPTYYKEIKQHGLTQQDREQTQELMNLFQ